MMKAFKHIIAFLAVVLAVSCSGHIDNEQDGLVLVPDKTEIRADGSQTVNFKVTSFGEDVTGEATVHSVNDESVLSGTSFSTSSAGIYLFYAEYQGNKSETVQITAVGETSAFKRNYCIAEFTSQQCTFCPNSTSRLYGYYLKEIFTDETMVVLSFHSSSMGEDIFHLDASDAMEENFKISGLPTFVFDFRDVGEISILRDSYTASKNNYPAHCGLSLESSLSADGQKATVKVGLASAKAASYRVALFVVEDNIIAKQKTQTGEDNEYEHRDVVRAVVSATWRGDNFGELAEGQTVTRDYEIEINSAWNTANLMVCAVAYDENGYANNCLGCAVDGGKVDFERDRR